MLDAVIHLAREAACAAGEVLLQGFNRPQRITLKGVHDPVTESDLASQAAVVAAIRQTFPHHQILAEEDLADSSSAPASDCRWIIDPLDGTVNFAHGFPMFCVSIAFEQAGQVLHGVVYDPVRRELFEATRGQGAHLNGQPLQVSEIAILDQSLLATGFPYDVAQRLESTVARFRRFLVLAQGVRRAGSAALDLCYLAAGRFDGFWEENLKPWDTAAAALIVAEAGGRVSTLSGAPYTLTSPFIVASNGLLHDQLLAALQE